LSRGAFYQGARTPPSAPPRRPVLPLLRVRVPGVTLTDTIIDLTPGVA
jgi:hypothetical protein